MKRLLFLLLLMLIPIVMLEAQDQDSIGYENVGPEDFLSIIRFKENVILLDVRLPFEYRHERIEKSINMPLARKFIQRADKLNREALVLVYCTTDVRSERAAEKLCELGFSKVYNLKGGIEAWKRKGLAVVKKRVRSEK